MHDLNGPLCIAGITGDTMQNQYVRLSGVQFGDVDGETLFSFLMVMGENEKRYQFETRSGANRGRALMIKKLKADGMKVLC